MATPGAYSQGPRVAIYHHGAGEKHADQAGRHGLEGAADVSIIVTNRSEPLIDEGGLANIRFASLLENLVNVSNDLTEVTSAYTTSNVITDRTFDADAAAGTISATPTQAEVENIRDAILELADVIATIIADLKNKELLT